MSRLTFGKTGEDSAVSFIKKLGIRPLSVNYASSKGELDITALDGDTLVFVEVKTKTATVRGCPSAELTEQKKAALYRTGTDFCKSAAPSGRVPVKICGIKVKKKYKHRRFDLLEQVSDGEMIVRLIYTKGIIHID